MLEKLINNVIQKMDSYLNSEQLNKLQNVLFIEFHGKSIIEDDNTAYIYDESNDFDKIEEFRISKKIAGRQDSTLNQYVREIKNCKRVLNKNFKDITTMDLRWYFSVLIEEKGISMNTLKTRRRYLNSFWSFLKMENYVDSNPVEKIENFKVEESIKEPLSESELEALRVSCNKERDRALIEFLVTTGVRVSELCSLNIKDLDLYKQEFKVKGKGRKERTLYLSDAECFYLHRYLDWRLTKENKTLEELSEEPLFTTIKSPYNRMTKAGVQYLLKQIGKRANVKNVHPHRFRRTFASNLLSKGMKIEEVMVLMGHTKIETTLIYCNIKQETVKSSYKKYAA